MRPIHTSTTRVLTLAHDTALRRRFMVVDRPLRGNLRFGLTLEILDALAEDTALSYVRQFHPDARVVTAAIDGIRVLAPADVTRDLLFLARVNYVGRTSLEVGIRVEQDSDPPRHIASCYFTMVARQGEASVEIPPLEYGDDLERSRLREALERREANKLRQREAHEPPSREEFELLRALRREQHLSDGGLLARDLVASSWERVYPEQENVPQKIFGGYVVNRAYELASIHAESVSSHRPVVAAVNRINFLRPVRIGDILRFTSKIIYTGRTSIAVDTRIERIGREHTVVDLSNDCMFTFVNVDDDLRPQPVPRIYPTSHDEDTAYLAAYRRSHEHAKWKAESADPLEIASAVP